MSKHSKEAAQKSPITTNKTPTTSDRQVFESTLEAMIKNKPALIILFINLFTYAKHTHF